MTEQKHEDIINILYKEGEEKPWVLDYHDVGLFKTARAALNYPAQKFETEEKAIEVATMLQNIIKAKVAIPSENTVLNPEEHAEFFHPIPTEDETEHKHISETELVTETEQVTFEQIRTNRENQGLPVDTDTIIIAGPSQKATEKELGLGTVKSNDLPNPPPRLP